MGVSPLGPSRGTFARRSAPLCTLLAGAARSGPSRAGIKDQRGSLVQGAWTPTLEGLAPRMWETWGG